MRGYLSHIAAKVTGAVAVVRPKVPSLFEPVRGADFVAAPARLRMQTEALNAGEQRAAEPKDSGHEPRAQQLRHRQTSAPPEPAVSGELKEDRRPQSRHAAGEADGAPRTVERQTTAQADEVRRGMPPEPQVVSAVEPRRSKAAVDWSADRRHAEGVSERSEEAGRKVTQERPAKAVFGAELKMPQMVARETSERERPVVVRTVSAPGETGRMERAEHAGSGLGVVRAKIADAAERRPAAVEPPAEAAPAVQVTIGRIVVEAVMPAAPAPPLAAPRPPGPRLSLDEYLRQRGGHA